MDKFSSVRSTKLSYKIDQVENGWTVTTVDGTVFIFLTRGRWLSGSAWVGVPFLYNKVVLDPLEEEIRKLTRATANLLA